ncbi:MAG: MarR family transcriptional regulator [Nanoarchaeota archaeon]
METDWKNMDSVVLLIRGGRIAVELLENEILSLGISVPQLSIILSLYTLGEMTASDLCQVTMRDKANISALTKKLELGGFIQLIKNKEDSRSSSISLTAKGKKTAQLGQKAQASVSKKLEGLSTKSEFPKNYLLQLIQKVPFR